MCADPDFEEGIFSHKRLFVQCQSVKVMKSFATVLRAAYHLCVAFFPLKLCISLNVLIAAVLLKSPFFNRLQKISKFLLQVQCSFNP